MRQLIRDIWPAALIVWGTIIIICAMAAYADQAQAKPHRHCAEDQACWTWSTMGNMQRGVHVIDDAPRIGTRQRHRSSNYRIVDACEFAFLSHWGGLARDTPRLKGDRLAERHGCDYRYFG